MRAFSFYTQCIASLRPAQYAPKLWFRAANLLSRRGDINLRPIDRSRRLAATGAIAAQVGRIRCIHPMRQNGPADRPCQPHTAAYRHLKGHMMLLKRTLITAALILSAQMAAALTAEELAAALTADGYSHIAIDAGTSQLSVRAYKDGQAYRSVYDAATGTILISTSQERGAPLLRSAEVRIRSTERDFVTVGADGTVTLPEGGPRGARPEGAPTDPEEGSHPEGAPEGDHPEGTHPEGAHPEGGRPEGGRPEGAHPEGGRPEGAHPEGGRPEGGPSEGARPEGPPPEGGNGDAPPPPRG